MPKVDNTTQYYDETAAKYDELHGDQHETGHMEALELIVPRHFPHVTSVLDVGSGTGRAISWFDRTFNVDGQAVALTGMEPSNKMREVAAQKVPSARFVDGYGDALPFEDDSFDLVTITGVLHHVADPKAVIRECFRVSKHGVLISDHNNFSFGSTFARKLRLALYSVGFCRRSAT
ncbi:MAG: class I SAM-dependent methyltransferase [Paracoccaceae bacterium]|nr:class I SAM-dependent methyltransferase [Paracoccaceae bacterium]MDG1739302.1 class I SAM-dependent methyltransferase [Paracoccaceae bacterium]MDG2260573.1 class I SAM-dependent methyltransferase [Paracoccaceae bacterium]